MEVGGEQDHKGHHKRQAGRKHDRKKEKAAETAGTAKHAKGNNWKAFSVQNVGKATRRLQHSSDKCVTAPARLPRQPRPRPTTTLAAAPRLRGGGSGGGGGGGGGGDHTQLARARPAAAAWSSPPCRTSRAVPLPCRCLARTAPSFCRLWWRNTGKPKSTTRRRSIGGPRCCRPSSSPSSGHRKSGKPRSSGTHAATLLPAHPTPAVVPPPNAARFCAYALAAGRLDCELSTARALANAPPHTTHHTPHTHTPRSLVKRYTRQTLNDIQGPVTVVTGKNRRLTFFECPNDVNAMLDVAKVADLVRVSCRAVGRACGGVLAW